ncbi:MAG: hypothetical protein K2N87_01340 [Eubacterium sp.]|nr:hypothetical protein [Eubacterium sp.]
MKFGELKERYRHRFSMRMVAGVLCVALLGGSLGICALQAGTVTAVNGVVEEEERSAKAQDTDAEKKADAKETDTDKETLAGKLVSMLDTDEQQSLDAKEETVYLITDANGKASQTIVSNWLKNGSKKAQITDVSELSEIKNVKGEETFTQNGSQIVWNADGQDIYYQGTTTKELPISEKVTYYLDGQEIAPNELAGKSGKVTIRFDYTNRAKTTAKVNGKKTDIYVPFTAVSGMILDDSFRNVRVNNGRVLSDGNRMIAVGIAMPGLKQSLDADEKDFDEDFEFPDYVEVTADVENFSLEMTATAVVAGLMSDTNLSDKLDFEELDETVDEMSDAMVKLTDGGTGLADGLDTLKGSMGSFQDGANTLASGVDAYTDGAARLSDGIRTLSDKSGALEAGVHTLNASAKTISEGVQALDQTLHTEMSEKEKAAVKKEVGKTIEAQFQKGSETYNTIYQAAVQNFEQTMKNETAVQTVQGGIQAGMQAQGLTSEGVVAALAQYYAEHGFTDAQGQAYSAQTCQSNVPGTETTYAAFFANAVLNGGLSQALADGITSGIASQGAASVGEAVTGACEMAAKQAGEAAAISGAESAKQKVAAAIEAKDQKSGHSLVSGTKALSEGTQQLAQSIPALKEGIGQLVAGADELTGNNAALKDGVAKLSDGAGQITDGVGKLDSGAHELSDGLKEFDKKAVKKIADAYHGDVKELTDRIQAIMRAGEEYRTFGGAAEDMDATTKFIIRTDSIKAEEE